MFAETGKHSLTLKNVTMPTSRTETGAAQNVLLNKGGSAPLTLPQDLHNAHQYVVTVLSPFKRHVMIKIVMMETDAALCALSKQGMNVKVLQVSVLLFGETSISSHQNSVTME